MTKRLSTVLALVYFLQDLFGYDIRKTRSIVNRFKSAWVIVCRRFINENIVIESRFYLNFFEWSCMSHPNESKPFRSCVVGVFINSRKEVLVALRSDRVAWQFPQGGVEKKEDIKQALYREMKEELGCDEFEILLQSEKKLRYDFPKNKVGRIADHYRGQEQTWFLCRFKHTFGPDLSQAESNEFVDTKWVKPEMILDSIVDWKKPVYVEGLQELRLIPKE